MVTQPQQPQPFFRKIPGQAFLWAAVAIFGASSAVTRRLTDMTPQ